MNTTFFIMTETASDKVCKKTFQGLYKQCYETLSRFERQQNMAFYVEVVHGFSEDGELNIEVYLDLPKFMKNEVR